MTGENTRGEFFGLKLQCKTFFQAGALLQVQHLYSVEMLGNVLLKHFCTSVAENRCSP